MKPPPLHMLTSVRLAFWAAAFCAFVIAVAPAQDTPHLMPWDKASHFLAFYVLSILAAAAYPRARLVWIGIGLSAFGAAIEIVQGLSFVHRDRDVWDWVADTIAILCALGPLGLARWRAWLAPG